MEAYLVHAVYNFFIHFVISTKLKILGTLTEIRRQIFDVPRMFLYFLHGNPLYWVGLEHLVDQVLNICRYVIRHVIFSLLYLIEKLCHRIIIKWQSTTNHCVKNHTHRPYVYFYSAISSTTYDLRGSIVWWATCCLKCLRILHRIRQTIVNQLYVIIIIKKKVFRF